MLVNWFDASAPPHFKSHLFSGGFFDRVSFSRNRKKKEHLIEFLPLLAKNCNPFYATVYRS